MPKEKLFDVVIYNIETLIIDTIAGKDMRLNTGFTNAEKREETVSLRLNDHYNVKIVSAGKYKKGDKLKGKDK